MRGHAKKREKCVKMRDVGIKGLNEYLFLVSGYSSAIFGRYPDIEKSEGIAKITYNL